MIEHVWIDRNDYTALLESLAKWKDKAANLTNQRDMFANGYANRGARVAELEQENERWKNDLNNLRQTYRETNVARNTLAEKVMRLEQENEELKKELHRLSDGLYETRRYRDELEQENETLKANLTAAEGEMRRLQNALECWKSEWDGMRGYEG